MSEVTFSVGGRNYTVACAEGEEERVTSLGADIDGKLQQLDGNLAPQEAQNLLFAALLLADESREARQSRDKEQAASSVALQQANQAQSDHAALQSEVAELEERLGELQSAQEHLSSEAETARREVQDRREEAEKVRAECERLTSTLDEVETDRDACRSHAEKAEGDKTKAELALSQARDENFKISKRIAEMQSAKTAAEAAAKAAAEVAAQNPSQGAAASAFSMANDDPDLAPALERFAEMLENCAIKLESGLESTGQAN